MTVYDFISKHPDNHIRIFEYIPTEDALDDSGDPVCGEEGTSTLIFDSISGFGDLSPYLLCKEVTNSPEDGLTDEELTDPECVFELEYIPDEYYTLF